MSWTYSWATIVLRPHFITHSGSFVIGVRRLGPTVRLRAWFSRVDLPADGLMVFDLAGSRDRDSVTDAVLVMRWLLGAADEAAQSLVIRVDPRKARLLTVYRRLGFYPVSGSRIRRVWMCRLQRPQ
jgi:hypothetical protein